MCPLRQSRLTSNEVNAYYGRSKRSLRVGQRAYFGRSKTTLLKNFMTSINGNIKPYTYFLSLYEKQVE